MRCRLPNGKEVTRDYARGSHGVLDAPLLILHGLLGSSMNWRSIAPRLSHRRRILAADLRNHGQSPHATDMTFRTQAEDIIALMDRKGIEKCVLLGHSLGGKVAMATALLHPHRIAALISVDMSPVDYALPRRDNLSTVEWNESTQDSPASADSASSGWVSVMGILHACASIDMSTMSSRGEVEKALRQGIPEWNTRMFVMQSVTEENVEGSHGQVMKRVRWKCNLPVLAQSLPLIARFDLGEDAMEKTQQAASTSASSSSSATSSSSSTSASPSAVPTLPSGVSPYTGPSFFVGGGNSGYITPSKHSPAIHSLLPSAIIHHIPNAGHWVHVDQTDEFVKEIATFLSKLEQVPQ